MAFRLPCSVLAVRYAKCEHMEAKNIMTSIPDNYSMINLFGEHHDAGPLDEKKHKVDIFCSTSLDQKSEVFQVEQHVSVGELTNSFNVKCVQFTCKIKDEFVVKNALVNVIQTCAQDATKTAINAFEVMMAGGRKCVSRKRKSAGMKEGLSRKDELYNNLVDDFESKGLSFPKAVADTDGAYIIQNLCNALWYLTNHHQVIDDAALRRKNVNPIPRVFSQYSGYDQIKRKKCKQLPLSATSLYSHSQALYSILMKPVIGNSPQWKKEGENIRQLADCMSAYREYLLLQNQVTQKNQSLDHPVRTIDKYATIEHRRKTPTDVKSCYMLLDEDVRSQPKSVPILFDEDKHLDTPFEDSLKRLRYFEQLQLSSPVDIIRFCPGGSILTTICIVKVNEDRSESEIVIDGARMLQNSKVHLQEFHTRAQRSLFKNKLQNVTKVLPSVADLIYKELTLDAATVNHPATQERLRLIFLGEQGLLADLRHLNAGRPTGTYDVFFDKLSGVVEEVTAADDRRHNVSHLSQWISLDELINISAKKCPEGTQIPSKSLVRLQFAPKNPYTRAALNFTGKIQVQYKIQRRQLRSAHPDDHYCAAQLKYFKKMASELKELAAVFFCDDKAKIPVGSPGCPISTGVRGKKSIAPTFSTFGAKDHDMSMSSITPSVILQCDVPVDASKSFVRGTVTNIVNDSVLETSNPFRHAAALIKVFNNSPQNNAKILMKFTDGGTDQRHTLEAVRCASICIFYELNLDMMILARCAPGQSWTNPAERVMSILNLALQNCALERPSGDDDTEREIVRCGSMANLRTLCEKKQDIKQKWIELIEPIQSTVRNRFLRLSLKEKPMQAIDPIATDEIDILQRHLREHFPDLNLQKLQKVHTKKCQSYIQWIEKHSRQRHYTFQLRKCDDANCCIPPTLGKANLMWLPDPVVNTTDLDHYLQYEEVKHQETEEDRPSMKIQKKSKKTDQVVEDTTDEIERSTAIENNEHREIVMENEDDEPEFAENKITTAQHARSTIVCVECNKPRVLYSKHVLTDRQNMSLVLLISDFEYTCGAPITPPRHNLKKVIMPRDNLSCGSPVELPYFSSDLGRKDICCRCGIAESNVCLELKKAYKTVLPLCDECKNSGKTPIVARPYGKKQ